MRVIFGQLDTVGGPLARRAHRGLTPGFDCVAAKHTGRLRLDPSFPAPLLQTVTCRDMSEKRF